MMGGQGIEFIANYVIPIIIAGTLLLSLLTTLSIYLTKNKKDK